MQVGVQEWAEQALDGSGSVVMSGMICSCEASACVLISLLVVGVHPVGIQTTSPKKAIKKTESKLYRAYGREDKENVFKATSVVSVYEWISRPSFVWGVVRGLFCRVGSPRRASKGMERCVCDHRGG